MPRIEPIPLDKLAEKPRQIIEEGVANGTYATPIPLVIASSHQRTSTFSWLSRRNSAILPWLLSMSMPSGAMSSAKTFVSRSRRNAWNKKHPAELVTTAGVVSTALSTGSLPVKPDYHVVPKADRFSFLAPCTPMLTKYAPAICEDPPGFDRTAFHEEFNAAVVAFFKARLPAG